MPTPERTITSDQITTLKPVFYGQNLSYFLLLWSKSLIFPFVNVKISHLTLYFESSSASLIVYVIQFDKITL